MTSPWPACSSSPEPHGALKERAAPAKIRAEGPVSHDQRAADTVLVRGSGVAADACVQLLREGGVPVARERGVGRALPPVLLSRPALALMRDIFGRPDLFAGRRAITRRIVAWGGAPVAIDHEAIALAGADLARAPLPAPGVEPARSAPASAIPPGTDAGGEAFILHCAPPFPAGELRHFGARPAMAASVALRHEEDEAACWLEALAEGWLFLVPDGCEPGRGRLIGVGAPLDALVARSRHIGPRITLHAAAPSNFHTAPRMLETRAGPGWLACGTSALAFDPICGDGTAQSVRSAILAAAVIRAIREGGDATRLRGHYEAMLLAAMRRHLRLCMQFYQSGGTGPWWRAQLASLVEGFAWCTERLAATPEPRFRLEGFRLMPLDVAA